MRPIAGSMTLSRVSNSPMDQSERALARKSHLRRTGPETRVRRQAHPAAAERLHASTNEVEMACAAGNKNSTAKCAESKAPVHIKTVLRAINLLSTRLGI